MTESEHSYNSQDQYSTSSSNDFFSIGLDVIAGVEWSFYKNMSLSAEYGIKFYYYMKLLMKLEIIMSMQPELMNAREKESN